jgi:hypothetical protein
MTGQCGFLTSPRAISARDLIVRKIEFQTAEAQCSFSHQIVPLLGIGIGLYVLSPICYEDFFDCG